MLYVVTITARRKAPRAIASIEVEASSPAEAKEMVLAINSRCLVWTDGLGKRIVGVSNDDGIVVVKILPINVHAKIQKVT